MFNIKIWRHSYSTPVFGHVNDAVKRRKALYTVQHITRIYLSIISTCGYHCVPVTCTNHWRGSTNWRRQGTTAGSTISISKSCLLYWWTVWCGRGGWLYLRELIGWWYHFIIRWRSYSETTNQFYGIRSQGIIQKAKAVLTQPNRSLINQVNPTEKTGMEPDSGCLNTSGVQEPHNTGHGCFLLVIMWLK